MLQLKLFSISVFDGLASLKHVLTKCLVHPAGISIFFYMCVSCLYIIQMRTKLRIRSNQISYCMFLSLFSLPTWIMEYSGGRGRYNSDFCVLFIIALLKNVWSCSYKWTKYYAFFMYYDQHVRVVFEDISPEEGTVVVTFISFSLLYHRKKY